MKTRRNAGAEHDLRQLFTLLVLMALTVIFAGGQDVRPQLLTAELRTIERRTPREMSSGDAELLLGRHADVVRAAEFFAIDLTQGQWTYEQSVCPLLPQHLIINYVRGESSESETRFAAVVPRGREPVRVVAVERNGLAPFAPAETSPNSVALFNRVWAAERGDIQTIETEGNWITLGLCYAEMVGSHPLIVTGPALVRRNAGPPTLRFESDGGASTLFTDVGMPAQTWNWALLFDRRGALRSVTRSRMIQPTLPSATRPVMASVPVGSAPVISAPVSSRSSIAPSQPVQPTPSLTPAATAAQPPSTIGQEPSSSAAETENASVSQEPSTATPDVEAPAGRIVPDGEAPAGRFIPDAQDAPGSARPR